MSHSPGQDLAEWHGELIIHLDFKYCGSRQGGLFLALRTKEGPKWALVRAESGYGVKSAWFGWVGCS
jgi:hypothetical protein